MSIDFSRLPATYREILLEALSDEVEVLSAERARLAGRIAELERRFDCPRTVERFTSKHAEELDREGVTSIEGFLDPARCDELRTRLEGILASYPDEWPFEDETVVKKTSESKYALLDNADAIARYPKAVIQLRSSAEQHDVGMIDVFNPDLLIPELRALKEHPQIRAIVSEAARVEFDFIHMNAYVNKSVTRTREFHVDAYCDLYKAFVYLTDVPDLAHGPYAYVRGSHRPDHVRFLNTRLSQRLGGAPTDVHVFDPDRVVHFTAPRGTLIISNQAGIHRGMPQEPGAERVLLLTKFIRFA